MAAIDRYRQASFRGVEFKVDSHTSQHGRRQVTNEYPQGDFPYTEDLGRKCRVYKLDAYLIGDDYDETRDKLIAEFEKKGIGELVHPYYGNLDLVPDGLDVSETKEQGRMCRLSMSFVEGGKSEYPTDATDSVATVSTASGALRSAATSGFTSGFRVTGFQSFVGMSAIGSVTGFSSFLQTLALNPASGIQAVAGFLQSVENLAMNAATLVGAPSQLAAEISGIIGQVRDVFGSGAELALIAIRGNYYTPYSGPIVTPSRVQEAANFDAIGSFIRQVAIAEQALAAVIRSDENDPEESGFETREDAVAVRDEILDGLDFEIEAPQTTTEQFQALSGLRAEVVRGIPSPSLRLPSIATVTPLATIPSLVLAYALYKDANRGKEIAERNKIEHPGFLTGGNPLQVVSNV